MQLHGQDYYHDEALALSIVHAPVSGQFPLHSHDFTELVVVLAGTGYHVTADRRYLISAGDVFVIKGNTRHGYADSETLDIVNVLFNLPELSIPTNDLYQMPAYYALFALEPNTRETNEGFHHQLRLTEDELSRVSAILLQLEFEFAQREAGYREMAIALFSQAMVFLSRRYDLAAGPESRRMLSLGKVLSHVERHLADSHSLKQLADVAGMSISTLQRSFRRALGASPAEYVMRKRLARAAELLRGTDTTVTEVAYSVGFWDSNYFSRCFRKNYGCSPREWRNEMPTTQASELLR